MFLFLVLLLLGFVSWCVLCVCARVFVFVFVLLLMCVCFFCLRCTSTTVMTSFLQIVLARLGISFKDVVTENYMSRVELREPELIVANALDSKYFSCVRKQS